MNRMVIHNPTPTIAFDMTKLQSFDDDFWKSWIFHYLFDFLENFDIDLLKVKIERESLKKQSRIEDCIAKFIRRYLNQNEQFIEHFDVVGENINDESEKEGYYDITIFNTYWRNSLNKKGKFHFECKNLDINQDLVNKYVFYDTYKKDEHHNKIYDGGVYRFFNGKYAPDQTFGGMIGFVLSGSLNTIKNNIQAKLNDKFDITPEGDLISITDNSIAKNPFTFDSRHHRKGTGFLLHHLLFDFT